MIGLFVLLLLYINDTLLSNALYGANYVTHSISPSVCKFKVQIQFKFKELILFMNTEQSLQHHIT